ncbi:helix-turn-helix domain-containing protein [Zobellella denitrificans]|uniref:helix-turn-helix domain-containing protein n=1 Tax=Zobellella denitrificans TaxID=347534 RepID=UPI000BBE4467|nr:helix-turn-helix transcriptional regulator [Zobellella denitrificans]
MQTKQKRQAVVFPKEQKILQQLGENIRLAMKRRKITQTMIAERTGLSKPTLRNIERGESTVSIGHYLRVLAVLGLAEDLAKVALDDAMGRKLQDIALLKTTQPGARPASGRPSSTSGGMPPPPTPKASAPASQPASSQRIQSLLELARSRANQDDGQGQNAHDGQPDTSSSGEDT